MPKPPARWEKRVANPYRGKRGRKPEGYVDPPLPEKPVQPKKIGAMREVPPLPPKLTRKERKRWAKYFYEVSGTE